MATVALLTTIIMAEAGLRYLPVTLLRLIR